jgi:hypothetical protein
VLLEDIILLTAEDAVRKNQAETERWTKVIKAAGIRAN